MVNKIRLHQIVLFLFALIFLFGAGKAWAEGDQDAMDCLNKIHLYDANGQIVNPGDTVTFGEQYRFGTEPGSGCSLYAVKDKISYYGIANSNYYYWSSYKWRFYAVYCNEDGTDCVEDSKREMSYTYDTITPGGTGFTAGSSCPMSLLPDTPPDDQHTYRWMVGRTWTSKSSGVYYI